MDFAYSLEQTQTLAHAIISGDVRSLARAATLIEAQTDAGLELSKSLFPYTGKALPIGITGPPGAGKSTLVNSLIRTYRTLQNKVGVIAVDPSSPYSQGALLGDRIRMLEHYSDPAVFIRSMATRGRLGGLAAATMDLLLLMEASGREIILIETVGIGQDEIDIAHLAAVTVLVLSPGAGDDIQALKAGILEVADIIVINKADQPGADRLHDQIIESQMLVESGTAVNAPVCKTSASAHLGINELVEQIKVTAATKLTQSTGTAIWAHRLRMKLRDDLMTSLPSSLLAHHARKVSDKLEDPHSAIMALKAELFAYGKHGN